MRTYFGTTSKLVLFSLILIGCKTANTDEKGQTFKLLTPEECGINFSNTLIDDDDLPMHYQYRYNGNGVAVGDINNDGLPDLFFAGVNAQERLYLNKGNLRFDDITKTSGILLHTGISTGAVMVDINADGWLDIYVCKFGKFGEAERRNQLYINQTNNTFKESAADYGLDDASFSSQASFYDYDRDGDLDLFLVNSPVSHELGSIILFKPDTERVYVSNRLYRNDGNEKFTDITFEAGVDNKGFGFNATTHDFNNDGWPDIYVTNDFISPDYLYINQQDGTFKEELSKHFRIISNSSMGSDVADINNDGLMDLITLDMLPESNHRLKMLRGPMNYDEYTMAARYGYYFQHMRNMLHVNNGNGTYSEIGQLCGVSNTDWSWGPLLADFNNDRKTDLFVANGYRRDLTNLDYTHYFLDSINKTGGIQQFKHLYELFNLVPATPLPNYLFINQGEFRFENKSDEMGLTHKTFSNGSMYSDLDNDGDLDIIINNIDEVAHLYENKLETTEDTHWLQVRLQGSEKNTHGIGAYVYVYINGEKQVKSYVPTTGYYSCAENRLHFGMGGYAVADSIVIHWPDDQCQTLKNTTCNQLVKLDYKNSSTCMHVKESTPQTLLTEITNQSGIQWQHSENIYIDYKREPLLPFKFSSMSPCMATGDFNGDGKEDIFIGNASGAPSALFVQQGNHVFKKLEQFVFEEDKLFEDASAQWIDYDNDGDQDLYVASGGNEKNAQDSYYLHRLYINNGKGKLLASRQIIPDITESSNCVKASDFDSDGDQDLFIGGSVIPGKYPLSPRSYLLINENGKFIDKTASLAPAIMYAGLINDAYWEDINGDAKIDLVITGYWEGIKIYLNKSGILELQQENGLEKTNGWWNCVKVADIDGDGDMDIAGGNLGLNTRIKASEKEPACVYVNDFDKNGSVDAIMCTYLQGKSYPIHNRDVLIDQIRPLKNLLLRYHMYADAQIEDLFPKSQLDTTVRLNAYMFESAWFENDGKGNFQKHILPVQAQFAPVQDMVIEDIDLDGISDMLLVGNFFDTEVETGRYTAFNGLLLKGTNNKTFEPLTISQSGFYNSADARSMELIKSNNQYLIVVANNNSEIKVFKSNKENQKSVSVNK